MTYGTLLEAAEYWAMRGYEGAPTLPLLARGSLFVDSFGWRITPGGNYTSLFPGTPAFPDQDYQWPRVDAVNVYGVPLSPSEVPLAVRRAAYEAAHYEHESPGALNAAVRSDERIVREKYGPVEFQYADAGTSAAGTAMAHPVIPAVLTLLATVLRGQPTYGITGIVA